RGPADTLGDGGGNGMRCLRSHLETRAAGSFVDATNWSAVGAGLPMAIGARAARPTGRVVCVTGDGGFLMSAAELETAVRERLPVTTVVLNDQGFGNVRAYQREQYGSRWVGSDFGPTDLARLAETLGARGWRVESWGELGPALDAALGCSEPSVVDVHIDPGALGATLHKAPSAS